MTIVKDSLAIRFHAFSAIDEDVGDLIAQTEFARGGSGARSNILMAFKFLEAYCDVSAHRISMTTVRRPAIEKILQGFTAAMAGKELVDLSKPIASRYCRDIYKAFNFAKILDPTLHAVNWQPIFFKPDENVCEKVSSATEFKRWYWAGWPMSSPRQPTIYLRLSQLVEPYGQKLVGLIHTSLEQFFRNRTNTCPPEINLMFDYIGANHVLWPLREFKNEAGLKRFMNDFTIAHFTSAKEQNRDAKARIKSWNKFLNAIQHCLCKPEIWSSISSPFKRPPPSTKHGSETQVKQRADGLLVQEKTLTSIPLHCTDSEAIDVIFFHIKKDIATVRGWATAQLENLKSRYSNRVLLAQQGTPIPKYEGGSGRSKMYSLADICATLENTEATYRVPPSFLCKVLEHNTGEICDALHLANIFGFPVARSLFPLQCLLVLEHPEITTDFLISLELYDRHGQLIGFDEEKRLLIGYKNRKQPNVREQIVELSDKSYSVVKDIIEITDLARRSLKAANNDDHRFLFITSGKALMPFKKATATTWNGGKFRVYKNLRDELLEEFKPHSDLPEDELLEFIKRVRLTKIRASRAVEIFIQSRSTEVMSKALGHEHYYPDLLSHYLPDPLLAFIKARWIRIFQKALVCEAMKDSPYLFRATQFNSIAELHSFLENHQIKEIPLQASDPERKAELNEVETSEAVFSISVPFLASLLSVEAAVINSTDRARVCGIAEYWSSLAEKIKSEISSGYNRSLKRHLQSALKLVDAKKMETLIYVPAHWSDARV